MNRFYDARYGDDKLPVQLRGIHHLRVQSLGTDLGCEPKHNAARPLGRSQKAVERRYLLRQCPEVIERLRENQCVRRDQTEPFGAEEERETRSVRSRSVDFAIPDINDRGRTQLTRRGA